MTITQYLANILAALKGTASEDKEIEKLLGQVVELEKENGRMARIHYDRLSWEMRTIGCKLDRVLNELGPGPISTIVLTFALPDGTVIGRITTPPNSNPTGEPDMTDPTLKDDQQAVGTFDAKDKKQQPITLTDANISLTSSDPNVATVSVGADGTVALVAGLPGTTQLTGTVTDPSNPDDVKTITPATITVIAGDIDTVSLNFGDPTAQDASVVSAKRKAVNR